jgi:nucleotide-binding universal stress UspA family protein
MPAGHHLSSQPYAGFLIKLGNFKYFHGERNGGNSMAGIVCAVRGGPGSHPTINKALALGAERGLPVYFLYVVNLDFLAHTSSKRLKTVKEEMSKLGEFILLKAQKQADQRGVQTESITREGKVREEILRLCKEKQADFAVLGHQSSDVENNVFSQQQFKQFIQRLERETGAQVVVTEEAPGE